MAIVRARSAQLPGMFFVRRSIDATSDPPSRAFATSAASARAPCRAGSRRDEARRAGRLHPPELAVELPRVRLQPREVRLGVVGVLDAVVAVEKSRHVEVGADVLDDDVRRVAPAADGHVAIGQREAFERGRVGAPHDLDAGPRRATGRRVDGLDPGEVVADLLREPLLPAAIDRRAANAATPSRRCRCPATSRSPARGAAGSRQTCRAGPPPRGPRTPRRPAETPRTRGVWSRPHPVTRGRAAAEANAARASRRLSNTIRPS